MDLFLSFEIVLESGQTTVMRAFVHNKGQPKVYLLIRVANSLSLPSKKTELANDHIGG